MKKTVDFSHETINQVMDIAWELKLWDFGPALRLLTNFALSHKDEFLKNYYEKSTTTKEPVE